jgi:hypothetical protein
MPNNKIPSKNEIVLKNIIFIKYSKFFSVKSVIILRECIREGNK